MDDEPLPPKNRSLVKDILGRARDATAGPKSEEDPSRLVKQLDIRNFTV